MKKLLCIATVLTITISNCSQKTETSTVIIAGNLKHYDATQIRVITGVSQISSSIEEGNFKIIFDADETGIYDLRVIPIASEEASRRSRFSLFLSPGDSIYFTVDFNDFKDSFNVTGDHAAENTYLFEKQVRHNLHAQTGLIDWWPFMNLDNERYFSKKDSLFNAVKSRYEVLRENHKINPAFVKWEDAYFSFEPLLFDLMYSQISLKNPELIPGFYHRMSLKDSLVMHRTIEQSADGDWLIKIRDDIAGFPMGKIWEELEHVDVKRRDLRLSQPYIELIDHRINYTSRSIMSQDSSLGFGKARLMAIERLPIDQAIKDLFLYRTTKFRLDYRGPVHAKALYEKFMDEQQSPKLAAKLKESHDIWDTILPGMEVPDFTFVTMEDESVKLSDLRGNLVYVDIWSTWCVPCIAEHPYWDKLREEYKDKAVSFLTISVDETKVVWEKMVKAKNMEGLQWYAPKAFTSELAQHFMVSAIPRFLLLDREGKVIDPSAEAPSGDIRAMLDQHL